MRKRARHAARRVVLGQAIGREHEREALIAQVGVAVVGTNLLVDRRIGRVLGIKRIAEGRFQRLVVRGQRTVFQAAGDVQPADAVGMQDERLVAGDGIHALCALGRLVVGPLLLVEVGTVKAGPLLLLFVPPDQLLALAPRLAVGTRRSAVVQDAHVVRPGESPAVSEVVDRLALVGDVLVLAGMNAAVNPAAARGACRRLSAPGSS